MVLCSDNIIKKLFSAFFVKEAERKMHMTDICSNKSRFLVAIIVAFCLLAAPVLQAATLYNQSEKSESESVCCCCPNEKDTDSCPVKEIMQVDDCPCNVEQSEPVIPAPLKADIQTKTELKQNQSISKLSIGANLSDKPALVLSDNLIKSIHSPPLYISNSAFLI